MLDVKPYKNRPAHCGPASLKIVLNYYNIPATEKKLAFDSKHSSHKGASAEGLMHAAKKYNCNGFIKDFADITDIRRCIKKKIPVIVDWFSEYVGHYSVVVDVKEDSIYLQDPELGHLRTMKIRRFKSIWFDFVPEFLQKKEDIIIRRMIVIYPREKKIKL